MHRHELTDQEWKRLKPLLPREFGRPPKVSLRRFLNAVLWKVKTGVPWRDLPRRYGKWQTIYSRFKRWADAGRFKSIFESLQVEVDELWNAIDGSYVRVHQHGAGGKGGPRSTESVDLEEAIPQSFMLALMLKEDLAKSRSRQGTSTTARKRRT